MRSNVESTRNRRCQNPQKPMDEERRLPMPMKENTLPEIERVVYLSFARRLSADKPKTGCPSDLRTFKLTSTKWKSRTPPSNLPFLHPFFFSCFHSSIPTSLFLPNADADPTLPPFTVKIVDIPGFVSGVLILMLREFFVYFVNAMFSHGSVSCRSY